MIRGPRREAALVGWPVQRQILSGVRGPEDLDFVQVQVVVARQLDSDKPGGWIRELNCQRFAISEPLKSLAVMLVNLRPPLSIVGKQDPEP